MRSTSTRPAPRWQRGAKVSQAIRAPVAAAIRPAAFSPRSFSARPTDQDHGFSARSQARRRLVDGLGGCDRRQWFRQGGRRAVSLQPRRVGGQDQRRDLSRILQRCLHGSCAVGGDGLGARGRMHPSGDRAGKSHDVRGKRRIILRMIGRVVADDIDDRRRCATRVVKVGEPVRQPWPQMQQRGGWLLRHAAITIGHPGHRAFEKTEHGPHARDFVERCDKMHFRGAGIAETDLDARADKRPQQTFRAVHICASSVWGVCVKRRHSVR